MKTRLQLPHSSNILSKQAKAEQTPKVNNHNKTNNPPKNQPKPKTTYHPTFNICSSRLESHFKHLLHQIEVQCFCSEASQNGELAIFRQKNDIPHLNHKLPSRSLTHSPGKMVVGRRFVSFWGQRPIFRGELLNFGRVIFISLLPSLMVSMWIGMSRVKSCEQPETNPVDIPLNPGWLMVILTMVYYNPYITG